MTPLGGFAAKDALVGDGNEGYDSKGGLRTRPWICNWPEDNVRLWMHRMQFFEGAFIGFTTAPRCCMFVWAREVGLSLAMRM